MEKTNNFFNNQRYILGEKEEKKVVSSFIHLRILEKVIFVSKIILFTLMGYFFYTYTDFNIDNKNTGVILLFIFGVSLLFNSRFEKISSYFFYKKTNIFILSFNLIFCFLFLAVHLLYSGKDINEDKRNSICNMNKYNQYHSLCSNDYEPQRVYFLDNFPINDFYSSIFFILYLGVLFSFFIPLGRRLNLINIFLLPFIFPIGIVLFFVIYFFISRFQYILLKISVSKVTSGGFIKENHEVRINDTYELYNNKMKYIGYDYVSAINRI